MKFIVLVTLMVLATAFAAPTVDEARFVFNGWVKHHGKHYTTHQEATRRFSIFHENLAVVLKHNEEAALGKHTYTLGMNKMADLTNEEYRSMYLQYQRPLRRLTSKQSVHMCSNESIPDSVDWRTKGIVTGVKDQGQCGSCWSFSTTGSIEGAYALKTGNLVSLSEQNLVDCVSDGQFTCDAGGDMPTAFQWVIDNNGIEGESDYPYCTCSGNQCNFDSSKVRATISGYKNIAQGSETDLTDAASNQPISVAIDASKQSFQLYSGGVYNEPACSSTELDHGVLVVGYGTDATGGDYYIVKNSWSDSWGLQGYILMSRNSNNQCGIATDASYPIA